MEGEKKEMSSAGTSTTMQKFLTTRSNKTKARGLFLEDTPSPPEKRAKRPVPSLHCSSDEEEEDGASQQQDVVNSVYQARPIRGIFKDTNNLEAYINDMVVDLNVKHPEALPIVQRAAEIKALRVKLNKIPKKATHFRQFSYKTPIRLAIVTNMYGVFVNTAGEFNERKKIFDIAHLEPKHRLSMLVSSAEYWWHEQSKQLMQAFFEDKLVHDLKSISSKDEFTEAINKFEIADPVQAWRNLKDKILTSKKANNKGGLSPGVWNIKVQNTQTIPSTIPIQLMEFKDDKMQCAHGKWKRLVMEPKYIHAFAVISIAGFKITRSGMSLDTDLEFMGYTNVPLELQTLNNDDSKFAKNFVTNSKWFTGDSVSSDDETPASSQKTPRYDFD